MSAPEDPDHLAELTACEQAAKALRAAAGDAWWEIVNPTPAQRAAIADYERALQRLATASR